MKEETARNFNKHVRIWKCAKAVFLTGGKRPLQLDEKEMFIGFRITRDWIRWATALSD